jgi:hypothetical protein
MRTILTNEANMRRVESSRKHPGRKRTRDPRDDLPIDVREQKKEDKVLLEQIVQRLGCTAMRQSIF